MRNGPLIAVALVVFLAVTGVLVHLGRSGAADPVVTAAPSAAAPETKPAPPPSTAQRPESPVPLVPLKSGDTPPQFVLFSLDGAGSHEIWQRFLAAAEESGARFTAFLTGLNLIADKHRDAYTGPGHRPGKASTAFGGDAAAIATEVADLNAAYAAGHEIGTHYNGHFCAGNPPSGNDWTTADWRSELGQFFTFLGTFRQINGYDDMPGLDFDKSEIAGGRIPCLEGDLAAVTPVWKKYGMTYDTSKNRFTGIGWPELIDGIWEFQLPYAYSPAFDRKIVPMNYNLWATFNGAAEQPDTAPRLRAAVKQTYEYFFDEVYHGNRAPLVIETHANLWNGDSFVPPALEFMAEVCGKKDVICATYSDVVAWLGVQDPAVLAQLQNQPVVATGP